MRLWSSFLAVLFSISLGCFSGAEKSEPVTLPVPFSGALTLNARVGVADGFPLNQVEFQGHRSGNVWEVFDEDGDPVGQVIYDLNLEGDVPRAGLNNVFSMTITVAFDDGSTATSNDVQFFDFPFDAPPSFDVSIAAPDEPGARVVLSNGAASGHISTGTGLFAGAVGETMDLRYVYESIEHEDGVLTFFKINLGTWIIHY